jgi:autotransporter-associated beta strand protein
MKIRGVAEMAFAAGLFIAATAGAADYRWNNPAGGNWDLNGNWDTANWPLAADRAFFTNNITATNSRTITLNGSQACTNATFWDDANYTLDTATQTLTIGNEGLNWYSSSNLTVNAILAGAGGITLRSGTRPKIGSTGQLGTPATVTLNNTNNTFSGPVNIMSGSLTFPTNTVLGNAASLTFGTAGARGRFNPTADFTMTRNLTLAGQGCRYQPNGSFTYNGIMSGSGDLLIMNGDRLYFASPSDSTYSGGTRVWHSWTDIGSSGGEPPNDASSAKLLGTGNVRVEWGGFLFVNRSNNYDAAATVYVGSYFTNFNYMTLRGGFSALHDFVPAFTSDSGGMNWFENSSGANINGRLAYGQPQIGNGHMPLGCRFGATFTGTSLMADEIDKVYRFAGYNAITLNNNVLNDNDGLSHYGVNLLSVGAWFYLFVHGENNTFSGPLTINPAGILWLYNGGTTDPAKTPLGSTNGMIVLNGASPFGVQQNAMLKIGGYKGASQQPIIKSNLTFNSAPQLLMDSGDDPGSPTELRLATLTRGDRSTLYLDGQRGRLGVTTGGYERVTVGVNPPAVVNGMVSPAYTTYGFYAPLGITFLTYGANGFDEAAFYNATDQATFDAAAATAIVNLTAAVAVNSPKTVYALKTTAAISGSSALTIASGGLINNAGLTHTGPMTFSTEPIIYARNGTVRMTGVITSSDGLTKSGSGMLQLWDADNSATLNGTITINEGVLQFGNNSANSLTMLGSPTNVIVLNGGRMRPYFNGNLPWRVVVGPTGGGLGAGGEGYHAWTNVISGSGWLATAGNIWLNGTNNTYTGGTIVDSLQMAAGGTCGTGPLFVRANGYLSTYGTGNISATQRVGMYDGRGSSLWELYASQVIGSLDGNGTVALDNGSQLSLGNDNTSSEFAGTIKLRNWPSANNSGLVKQGTGTFVLSGYNTYDGLTTVSNGTLLVNGTIDNANTVQVSSVSGALPVLGGNGVVKSTVKLTRGALVPGYQGQGTLMINNNVTLDAASTYQVTLGGTNAAVNFGQLSATGTISLNGAALNVTLTYAPQVGHQFTILNNTGAGAISGQFAQGRIVGATYLGKTYYFSVNYAGGTGNDIVLTALPQGTIIFIR